MSDLAKSISLVNSLTYPSATKHVLILLLARQELGVKKWVGKEALSIDSAIPEGIVEKAIALLRAKGILRLSWSLADDEYQFRVDVKSLNRIAHAAL